MRRFIAFTLFNLFLTVSIIHASDYLETGRETIQEIELRDTIVSNFLQEVIITDLRKLNLDSANYDIYLSINAVPERNSPSEYFIIITAEQTKHIPYALNVGPYNYSFFKMGGYIFFSKKSISELYAAPTGKTQEFEFDNRESRPDPENNFIWAYWIIGDLKHPKKLQFRVRASNVESWEKVPISWIKFYKN